MILPDGVRVLSARTGVAMEPGQIVRLFPGSGLAMIGSDSGFVMVRVRLERRDDRAKEWRDAKRGEAESRSEHARNAARALWAGHTKQTRKEEGRKRRETRQNAVNASNRRWRKKVSQELNREATRRLQGRGD